MPRTNVDYEIVIYDELPPQTGHSGGGKSILNAQLETIRENPQAHNKPVRIGLYSQGTAATAAKNVLQHRFGKTAAVTGWKFYTRPVPIDTSPESSRTLKGLFAFYSPESIVGGAKEAHDAAEKERKRRLEQARIE